jgi:hypothetical protein
MDFRFPGCEETYPIITLMRNEYSRKSFITQVTESSRYQTTPFCESLDELIGQDDGVRADHAFVDSLDLDGL